MKSNGGLDILQTLAENIVLIKMKIAQARNDKPLKSIMVTSADYGEGVSSFVTGLASAFAQQDKARVLLIDANLRRPGIHRLFGLDLSNGFFDFISGRADMLTLIKDTAYPQLKVMSAGQLQTENALAVLSAITPDLKKAIEKDFDWIIYDTAPINSSPETLLTIALTDCAILVIRAEKTRWQSAEKAKEVLESVGANILGAVLNSQKNYMPSFLYERF